MEKKIAGFRAENKEGRVEKLDFEKENCLEELGHLLKRRSFFDEPELVVVFSYLSAKDLQKKDSQLFKFLNKEAKEIKEFESIRGVVLEKWALEKVVRAGFIIKPPVLKKLLSRIISQEQLNQEIHKLIAFQSYHQKNEIDDRAVESLTKPNETAIGNFSLIDAIGYRDVKKAVTFLNQTLVDGAEPQAILGQFIYQFRTLLKVKSLLTEYLSSETIAKLASLHPFVARKTSQQAKQFEMAELKKIYQHLSELDIQSKTGQVDLIAGLFKFVLKM